eukprot:8902938-Lingulodinium_polyedra.AAC.1
MKGMWHGWCPARRRRLGPTATGCASDCSAFTAPPVGGGDAHLRKHEKCIYADMRNADWSIAST